MDLLPSTVLLIDASPEARAHLHGLLSQSEGASYHLLDAANSADGLRLWRECRPACVLLADRLPDRCGFELLATLTQASDGETPIIMLSELNAAEPAVRALRLGAQDYLLKQQLSAERLGEAIAQSIVQVRQRREQAQSVASLREHEQFISAILNTTPNLLYIYDLVRQRLTFVNHQIERMFGYTAAEYKAMDFEQLENLVYPSDRAWLSLHIQQIECLGEDEVVAYELRFRHKNGSWRWMSVHDRIFSRRPSGEVQSLLGIVSDITARKQAEAQLRLFEQVVIRLHDALLITEVDPGTEPDPRILYANPAFTRMTGYSLAELVSQSPQVLQGPDSAQNELAKLCKALKERQPEHLELVVYRKDGSPIDVAIDLILIATPTGWQSQWIAVLQETTARKAAEHERAQLLAQVQQDRELAEEAVRVRDQFLSIAAHELKNPLTVLLGNAQLLERRAANASSLPESEQRMLHVIHEQGDRLNDLITSLFDVSRIEMGQLLLTQTTLDLGPLVSRIVEDLQPTLTRHTLAFSGPSEPMLLDGDALRLEQVVHNLLGNAIKYSPKGGPITVQLARRGNLGCLTITDQGIGIPKAALPYLFQRFYRADNTRRQQISGTGVGLYVVKEIITRHGGEVSVSSTEGLGSSFIVCLPLHSGSPSTTTASAATIYLQPNDLSKRSQTPAQADTDRDGHEPGRDNTPGDIPAHSPQSA